MKPPKAEQIAGLETYLSKSKGIGGAIKGEPEDFLVEEITPRGNILEIDKVYGDDLEGEGEYTVFTLQKTNWDTLRAVKELSKRCGVSRKRIKFSGTKDRRAITTMRVSAWKVPVEKLKQVNIKDIELRDFSYSDEPVNLGTLKGNRFTLQISGVGKSADKTVKKLIKELRGKSPNFFGLQRFGSRLNTHLVGKALLKGQFKEAVEHYLCDTGNEPEAATAARDDLRKTGDYKTALKEFPNYLGFEKSILNHLINTPTDYIGAMRKLPKKLRWMFVHAYQGYLFNLALSEYIKAGKAPDELPLVGYESEVDKATAAIMKKEGINKEEFKVSAMPELSSRGETRQCFIEFEDFEILDFNEKAANIRLRFSLPAGSYATVLLRELMKD